MPDPADRSRSPRSRPELWLLTLIALVLRGWALRAMTSVFVPVIVSFFLALVIYPLDRMAAERLPGKLQWLGHVLALSVVLLALMLFLGCLWLGAEQLVTRFEGTDYTELVPQSLLNSLTGDGESTSRLGGVYSDATRSLAGVAVERITGMAQWVVNAAGAMLAGSVLVIFLILMMLIEVPQWNAKLASAASQQANLDMQHAMAVIAARLRRYLLTRMVIGVITGGLYALWLWILGIDLLFVWAMLAFLLNFVPTFGSLIAGVLATAYAMSQTDLANAALVAAGLLVIEQVMGNFVDPRMQGKQVSVSPLVILIVLVLWTWIWGPVGAILAVPIIVALVIFSSHFSIFRSFALFLSNESAFDELDRMTGRDAVQNDGRKTAE